MEKEQFGEKIDDGVNSANGWESVAEMADKMQEKPLPTSNETLENETPSAPISEVTDQQAKKGSEMSGAELTNLFANSRKDFESYASEVTGGTIDKLAPHFTEDEAFFDQAMKNLSRKDGATRKLEEIGIEEIVQYYNDDVREHIRRHNELNEAIYKKDQSLGFFGRHFGIGAGARELKAMKAEQNTALLDAQNAQHRLERLEKMID